MRRLVPLVFTLLLVAGPLAAEASANRLSISRAKQVASSAVQRDFGVRVRMDSCTRRRVHRVICSFDPVAVPSQGEGLNALPESCTGNVVVALGHRTGRIKRSTRGVICGAAAAPSPDDLPGVQDGTPGATGPGPDATGTVPPTP